MKSPSVVMCLSSVSETFSIQTGFIQSVPSHFLSPVLVMLWVFRKQFGTQKQQCAPGCSTIVSLSPFCVISQTPLYPKSQHSFVRVPRAR